MTLDALVPLLRCPACGGGLAFRPVAQREPEAGRCGLLRCGCATYPVLDGVPILTRGPLDLKSIADATVLAEGPTVEAVAACVAGGDGLEALADLLTFPVCPWPLNRLGGARALSLREPARGIGVAARRRRTLRSLRRRDGLTAEDWMAAFYWHAPQVYDPFNYFFFRFSQPKHLATAGVLAALPLTARPLLDVACGYGHLLHAPTLAGQAAVGLDQNFHQVWVARHYVAPGAAFVCADADGPLPIASAAAAAALVSDAFPYLRRKAEVLAELGRATGGGTVVLASVGNGAAEHAEPGELAPEGYAALLDAHAGPGRWRVHTQAALVDRYLEGQAPTLARSAAADEVARSRYLTYVFGEPSPGLAPSPDRPHAVGTLRLNPLYRPAGGRVRFEMPSPWFATENAAMRGYLPPMADFPPAVAAAVAAGERTPEVEHLLRRFVVLGVPDRYARARRPATQRADRRLSASLEALRQRLPGAAAGGARVNPPASGIPAAPSLVERAHPALSR